MRGSKTIVLVTLVVLLVDMVASYKFPNGHRLVVNSSYARETISLSISSSSKDNQIQTFYMLFPQVTNFSYPNKVTHGKHFFVIEPPIHKDKIIYNDITDGQNWIGIKHPFQQKQVKHVQHSNNFLEMQILSGVYQQDFLIPLLDKPMSFIPAHSLYHCRDIVISIQLSQGYQDIAIFSRTGALHLEGQWKWKLFDDHGNYQNLYYNRFIRDQVDEPILITLGGEQCRLDPKDILQNKNSLDIHQHMHDLFRSNISVDHLVRILPPMPVFKYDNQKGQIIQEVKDQEL